jgi:hypothetical protein
MIFFSNDTLDMGRALFAAARYARPLIQIMVARVDMPRFDLS